MKCGPCLLLPESQRTHLQGKPDLPLERELPPTSILKDFPKLPCYLRLSARFLREQEKGCCRPTELIFFTVSSKVLGLSGFGSWSRDHVSCGEPLCCR